MLDEHQLARICYMLQFEIQLALEDPIPHWDDAHPWMRDIWVDGVRLVRLGCTVDAVHGHFLTRMAERGWRYGPARDARRKTHPMMRPVEDLDQLGRAKIRLIQATIVMLTLEMPART